MLDVYRVQEVIIADPDFPEERAVDLVDKCHQRGVTVRVAPSTMEILRPARRARPGHVGAAVRAAPAGLRRLRLLRQAHVRRARLAVPAGAALAAAAADRAPLVRFTSRGPIIYRSWRPGIGGEPFACLKFRTMYSDADERQSELESLNEASGALFKIRRDPRLTPVGRFLRRYSIDELPQLVNVLRGQMSLVGPRPLPAARLRPARGLAQEALPRPARHDRPVADLRPLGARLRRPRAPRLPLPRALVGRPGPRDPAEDDPRRRSRAAARSRPESPRRPPGRAPAPSALRRRAAHAGRRASRSSARPSRSGSRRSVASGNSRASATTSSLVITIGSPVLKRAALALTSDQPRAVLAQRLAHLVAEDRVARDVDARLARARAGRSRTRAPIRSPISPVPCRPSVRAISRSPSLASPKTGRASMKPSACRRSASCGWQNSGRSCGSSSRAVASQWSPCRWVSEHGVDAGDDLLRGQRQVDERIRARVGRVRDRVARAGGVELRVDEQGVAGDLHAERRRADQGQLHPLSMPLACSAGAPRCGAPC